MAMPKSGSRAVVMLLSLMLAGCHSPGTRVFLAQNLERDRYVLIVQNYRFNRGSLEVMVIPHAATLGPQPMPLGALSYYGVCRVSSPAYADTNFFGFSEEEFKTYMQQAIDAGRIVVSSGHLGASKEQPGVGHSMIPLLDGMVILDPTRHWFSCDLKDKGHPGDRYVSYECSYEDFPPRPQP